MQSASGVGMYWPEIAGCLRKYLCSIASERSGAIHGVWREGESGREVEGFQASFERGGTKLVLQVEVGDLERIDAKVADAIKRNVNHEIVVMGRIAAIRDTLDVMSLSRSKLEDGAKALVARAIKARQGSVEALSKAR